MEYDMQVYNQVPDNLPHGVNVGFEVRRRIVQEICLIVTTCTTAKLYINNFV